MRILVLGSDGQIGNPLCVYLRKNNHDVVEFDIYSNRENDLRKENILENIIESIDFVYFLAFDVGGSTYLKKYQNTYDFIDNNIKLMTYTFDTLKKHNKKFIFASSQMSNMSYSPYGVLKKIGEIYTEILNGVVVKFWNVYGYESDLNKSHVITDFILMAKNDGIIKMKTDGTEERQFLYSEDCCECLNILMEKYEDIDREEELHITNFTWNSILDIAKIVSGNFNDCDIIPSENKDNVQLDKRNEPDSYILNFWKPKTDLSSGIKEIINKYSK